MEISAGATVSYGHKIQITGNGGSFSTSKSNQNTVETIYANGNFQNVNEVHNNTKNMVLRGFNQEGGKVTGNIENLEVTSLQNKSTTTGSSSGVNIGLTSSGIPSSLNISGTSTDGNRAYVDNQSTFIAGEGSVLTVGKAANTGAVIGTEGTGVVKIGEYTGKDLNNYDTMRTTGGSIGLQTGNVPLSNIGYSQESRDKEGISRNTVVGNVEIGKSSGDEINRDISKSNETTRDDYSRTDINVESQTIEYASNPVKFKEDLEVAILEGKATGETILKTIENIVNGGKEDIGEPERRSLNEIKESVIRVKTAPEMDLIARSKDLNSPEVLEKLKIEGIEKFNPDNPDLPENVRARLDELAAEGKTIGAFYDKTTDKIFVNENLEDDAEIRASIAREWKIAEDLNKQKGKANEAGQLKSTVAGELAYDDILKRSREGKTESISTDELKEAVMDVDSEVTADGWFEDGIKWVKGTRIYKETEKMAQNPVGYVASVGKQGYNEIKYRGVQLLNTVRSVGASKSEKQKLQNQTQQARQNRDKKNQEAITQEENERKEIKRKKEEKHKLQEEVEKVKNNPQRKAEFLSELNSPDCNGKCVKEIQLDYEKNQSTILSCYSNSQNYNPNPSYTKPLYIYNTKEEMLLADSKLKAIGKRGEYYLDYKENVDKKNSSTNPLVIAQRANDKIFQAERIKGMNITTAYMSSEDAARVGMIPLNTSSENLRKYVDAGIITKNEANALSNVVPWVNFTNEMTKDVVVPLTFSIAVGIGIKNSEINNQKISKPLETEKRNWNFKLESPYTAVKNSEGNYTLGRKNEWNFDTKYNIPYTETGNKGQGLVSVPKYNVLIGEYTRNYDIFYRSISEKHYNRLLETGNIPPKKETSITQNFSYSSGYQEKYGGVTIEIKTKPGTLRFLEEIGVKNNSASIIDDLYPNMKKTFPGWEKAGHVQFKQEREQITINLGKDNGLEIFNKNIKEINLKKE